jgi:hypothetical protein
VLFLSAHGEAGRARWLLAASAHLVEEVQQESENATEPHWPMSWSFEQSLHTSRRRVSADLRAIQEVHMRCAVAVTLAALWVLASACARPSVLAPDGVSSIPGSLSAADAAEVTLASVTTGFTATSNNYVGQSVAIDARGAFNRIRFNWFDVSSTPVAFGTLYVLDREYLGVPTNLSESTAGFVAKSIGIVGGQYVFEPGVVLMGGRQYWFYTDTQGAFVASFSASTYAGGDMYITGMPFLPFHKAPASGAPPPPPGTFIDANFRLDAR